MAVPNVYVARRRLKVGTKVYVPGDQVPEANNWRHLSTYVHNGSLALVQTSVKYARGMNQRRPLAPATGNPDKHLERWYGEMAGWGHG